jgi:hypothetical protein
MGKKKTGRPAVTLPVVSRAAALAADEPPAVGAAGAEFAAGAPPADDLRVLADLIGYRPPPLPEPPGPRGAAVVAFRAAAAFGVLPPVPISYDPATETWVLLEDYSYVYAGHTLTAKAGFAFDLASVPRPLWWLIAPNELSISAPLFHDLLYVYRGHLREFGEVAPYRSYTRREADDLFLHLMEVEGISRWRRYAAYSAVRTAGAYYWAT